MTENIYLSLTEEFNRGRLRSVICSGQAVVLHRLAVMSKDGDWIVREDREALGHILQVLEARGAVYRFGAPLDATWLRSGWSSHFEFSHEGIRVRTDFFSRPPRISELELSSIWREQEAKNPPFTSARDLALIKMTQREKDYPIIGELARVMPDPLDQLRFSRSARDLIRICREHPERASKMASEREAVRLANAPESDPDQVAEELDAERRALIKADAERIGLYERAAQAWREIWPSVRREIQGLPLGEAHRKMCEKAEACLPKVPFQ